MNLERIVKVTKIISKLIVNIGIINSVATSGREAGAGTGAGGDDIFGIITNGFEFGDLGR